MKRLLTMAVLCGLAVLSFSSLASSQEAPVPSARAYTNKVSLKVTPKRDTTRAYKFMARGTVTPPSNPCGEGQIPGKGAENCRPPVCPPGSQSNSPYCAAQSTATMCKGGKVAIRYKRGANTLSLRRATLNSKCQFKRSVKFADKNRQLVRGKLKVTARFLGTPSLFPRSAKRRFVYTGQR